jgi:PASTA domain
VGMAPADQPALVCLIMVDEPTQFKYGGQSAGPIFREIVDRLAVSSNPVVALPTRSPIPAEPVAPVKVADSHVETAEFQPVNLVDAVPDDSIRIPDVRGASLATAKSRLHGFSVIVEGSGSRVLAQVPIPGMRSVRGQLVRLSLGEWRPGNMPDVQHCTLRDALLRLKDLGLEVEYRGQGRVLRQTPEPGTPVKAGESCTLELGWMG